MNENENQKELKLSFYSLSVILAVVVSTVNTVITFINTAKADYYYLLSKIGSGMGENKDLYMELYTALIFDDGGSDVMMKRAYIVAILSAVSTVLLIIALAKVPRQEKKPSIIMTLLALILSAGAVVAFFFLRDYASDCYEKALDIYQLNGKRQFSLHDYCFIGCIANTVCSLLAFVGTFTAALKYKKENK